MDTENSVYQNPEDWAKHVPEERMKMLRSEIGGSLVHLGETMGETRVLMYLDEIEKKAPNEVRKLAELRGKPEIIRFLNYLDNRQNLVKDISAITDEPGAVLKSQEIETMCNNSTPLIDPIDKNGLDAASYKLRLGNKYRLGKTYYWLHDHPEKPENKQIIIPPHSITVVCTYEWLNIPSFLIARWNLRVTKVYEGLVWVGSLQVDPGFQGFLSCPLYNLSNEQQKLSYMDALFTIDFVRTYNKDKTMWSMPGRYDTFDFTRLDSKQIQSAPEESFHKMDESFQKMHQEISDFINKTKEDLKAFQTKADQDTSRLETKIEKFQETVFVFISIIIAGLAIISSFGLATIEWKIEWMYLSPAILAIFLAVAAIVIARRRKK